MRKLIVKLKTIYCIMIMSLILTMITGVSMFAAVAINQQMVALQAIKEVTNQYFNFNIDVKGTYKWLSINTLAFYPSEPLPDNTAIEVTLKKGIKSELTGDVLENDYTWTFNTLRPIMQKSSPYDRQSELPTDVISL